MKRSPSKTAYQVAWAMIGIWTLFAVVGLYAVLRVLVFYRAWGLFLVVAVIGWVASDLLIAGVMMYNNKQK